MEIPIYCNLRCSELLVDEIIARARGNFPKLREVEPKRHGYVRVAKLYSRIRLALAEIPCKVKIPGDAEVWRFFFVQAYISTLEPLIERIPG